MALAAACSTGGAAAQATYHTSPECWSEPRAFHAGAPPAGIAARVVLEEIAPPASAGVATRSPNGAYRLWTEQPDTMQPGPWRARIVVDSERERYFALRVSDVAQPLQPRWLNEKLVFVRIAWGRVVFSDVIWDVERHALVFHELVNDGAIAFRQFQQACGGRCPCAAGDGQPAAAPQPGSGDLLSAAGAASTAAAVSAGSDTAITGAAAAAAFDAAADAPAPRLPMSQPAPGEPIGLLALPSVFGFGEGRGPEPGAGPVDVHAEPDAGAKRIGRIRDRSDVDYGEIGYEAGAVVVYAIQGDWYQVRLHRDGGRKTWRSGWVREPDDERYYSHLALLQNRFGYLNANWNGELWSAPDATGQVRVVRSGADAAPGERREFAARIGAARMTESGLWVEVALYRSSPCETGDQTVEHQGWIPAYSPAGKLAVWFWSRGC